MEALQVSTVSIMAALVVKEKTKEIRKQAPAIFYRAGNSFFHKWKVSFSEER
jgi:hypothetical protein